MSGLHAVGEQWHAGRAHAGLPLRLLEGIVHLLAELCLCELCVGSSVYPQVA